MPYIAIKGFPKDDETIRKVAERINAALLELWGCRQEHINISYEAIAPEEWDERIEHGEIERNRDKMLLLGGKWMSREKITIYAGADKLYEAHPGDSCETIKENVKKALDAVL